MSCQKCKSDRIIAVNAKTSDCFSASLGEVNYDGYVPGDIGIGRGDYIDFEYCADCGQIQNEFPLQKTELESSNSDEAEFQSDDE